MGFYVDVSEMKEATQQYLKAAETAQEALNKAKNAMNGIITSNAMYGQVGQAIANDINNNQNAVIVGLKNSYKLLGAEYQKTLQEFLSTTGETSESAVISEETLNTAKNDLNNMLSTHSERRKAVKTVYSEISDLINLSMPSNSFKEKKSTAEKHLDKIIEKVNAFDSAQKESSTAAIVSALKQQIATAEVANGLSYEDPRFMEFASQDQLSNAMKDMDDKLIKLEKEIRERKKKELKHTHPLIAVLNGDISWQEVCKVVSTNINTNWTAFLNKIEENLFNANSKWITPLLGFQYNKNKDYYFTNKHSIQSIGGFNDLFDKLGPLLGMNLDDEIMYFNANGKEYRLELWKGNYGFGQAYGAEVGLYYKNPQSSNLITQIESFIPGWYPCVEEMDQIPMKNTIYSFDSKEPLIINDTRDYAEDGKHFWNLAIRTDNDYNKEDLFTVTELSVSDPQLRQAMIQSLQSNSNIHFVQENGDTVKFAWKK